MCIWDYSRVIRSFRHFRVLQDTSRFLDINPNSLDFHGIHLNARFPPEFFGTVWIFLFWIFHHVRGQLRITADTIIQPAHGCRICKPESDKCCLTLEMEEDNMRRYNNWSYVKCGAIFPASFLIHQMIMRVYADGKCKSCNFWAAEKTVVMTCFTVGWKRPEEVLSCILQEGYFIEMWWHNFTQSDTNGYLELNPAYIFFGILGYPSQPFVIRRKSSEFCKTMWFLQIFLGFFRSLKPL